MVDLDRAEYNRRLAVHQLAGDVLTTAIPGRFDELHLAVLLIADSALLAHDPSLTEHARDLAEFGCKLESRLSRLFPKSRFGYFRKALNAGFVKTLHEEAEIYRLEADIRGSTEAEACIQSAFSFFQQAARFVQLIDSKHEETLFNRPPAPQYRHP